MTLRRLAVSLGVALVIAAGPAAAQPSQRGVTVVPSGLYADSWAVIVGINDYQHPRVPKLRYAVNDALAMEKALLAQGFRSERITRLVDRDATKARIEEILGDELRRRVGAQDRVLIFFAGHGKTDQLRTGEG